MKACRKMQSLYVRMKSILKWLQTWKNIYKDKIHRVMCIFDDHLVQSPSRFSDTNKNEEIFLSEKTNFKPLHHLTKMAILHVMKKIENIEKQERF